MMRNGLVYGILASFVSVAASAQTGGAAPIAASAGGPISPEDIMTLTAARDAQISPDGRHILYTTSPTISTQRPTRSTIWIADADGAAPPRRLVVSGALDGMPRWSPDSRSLQPPGSGWRRCCRIRSPPGRGNSGPFDRSRRAA
jgi:hypothetical protein